MKIHYEILNCCNSSYQRLWIGSLCGQPMADRTKYKRHVTCKNCLKKLEKI